MTPYDPYRHSAGVWWAQLLFMFAGAVVFVGALWLGLTLLFSLAPYMPTLP